MKNTTRNISFYLALAMLLVAPLWNTDSVEADSESIKLTTTATSEFPEGFRISIEASGERSITAGTIQLQFGRSERTRSRRLAFLQGKKITTEVFWPTGNNFGYVPPGTMITYSFELRDSSGETVTTKERQFVYHDVRFEWNELSSGPITISYHGPGGVRKRAEDLLDTIVKTVEKMGPVLGVDTGEPIRATMYNTGVEMFEALPPSVQERSRDLITAGQASPHFGTLLTLGGSRDSLGIASHEVTHILTHRAGANAFRRVPLWLDEGLAEYANVNNDRRQSEYDIALEFAVANETLMPSFGRRYPFNAQDTIVFYGQSRSIVNYMIEQFGPSKMSELLAALKTGGSIALAVKNVYGVTQSELDAFWLTKVRAEYNPTERARAGRPTPVPRQAVLPYSLTPQPNTQLVGDVTADPAQAPTAEERPEPTPAPQASTAQVSGSEEVFAQPSRAEPAQTGGGAGCLAPLSAGSGVLDLTAASLLVGLAGLRLRSAGNRARRD